MTTAKPPEAKNKQKQNQQTKRKLYTYIEEQKFII